MPAKGIHHVDLAVADVERSLTFYLGLLGPLGWVEEVRYPTYRGTEEVVYLQDPTTGAMLGLRPADGGPIATTTSGSSTSRSRSTAGTRWTAHTSAVLPTARASTFHPKRIVTSTAITRSSSSIPTGCASRSSPGHARRTDPPAPSYQH
jgi:catechol 2,3-dioxygenase-like lactoylglutathione lyase family enzyme